ncbi:MAG: hypothetical protein HY462_00690, partial [Parcubacteria group bacterium]|nr:hypothetical protein [Parcubacteria group bacterium]
MKTLRLATVCLLAVLASGHAYAAEIPPHTGVDLYGVQAYSDVGPGSVVAGDEITFYVSNTFAYDAAIYRLGSDPKSMAGDELIASLGSFGANPQAIHPGSYVHVENRIRGELTGLTIETWFQAAPYVGGWRGVMTQYASFYEEGFGLFLCDDKVAFYLGVGRDNLSTTSRAVIIPNMWHHLVATWDGNEKAIWVNGEKVGSWPFSGPANAGKEPLRLAAYGHNGKAGLFLNGTLATPAIYNRALSAQEIQSRYTAVTIQPPTGSHVLASWPFDEENGEVVRDVSGNNRNGRIINHGIWQVGGPRFNADVPRFGYDPATDQTRGHGLRFADDQLVDCGWEPTITWQIPITAKSGLYVLRLQFQWGGTSYYHVPFIVRRTSWQKRAPIAVVASTHTWWAYNSVSFPRPLHGYEHVVADFVPQRNTESTSFYRDHASVVPSYYVGLRMPNPYADPYLSWGEGDGVSHLLPVERLLHVWLEKQGYDFEIITDLDLHRNPSILAGRKVMILVGHNEYWSIPMYQNIEQYLNRGGNMLVMNGNTGFWRVSFDEDLLVMEGRKVAPGAGARVPYNRLGERYHEQDGLAGGLTRETGIPAWRLTGLETIGWVEHKSEQFGPLVVSSVDHPLFAGTGISAGDTLAYGAGGHEVDALLPTIFSVGGSPGLALSAFPQAPASGVTLLGHFTTRRPDLGVTILDWWANRSNAATSVASDVILWQRPEGGEVFNFG